MPLTVNIPLKRNEKRRMKKLNTNNRAQRYNISVLNLRHAIRIIILNLVQLSRFVGRTI